MILWWYQKIFTYLPDMYIVILHPQVPPHCLKDLVYFELVSHKYFLLMSKYNNSKNVLILKIFKKKKKK